MIDTDVCYLQDAVNDEILRRFRAFMEEYQVETYDEENKYQVTYLDEKEGILVINVIKS